MSSSEQKTGTRDSRTLAITGSGSQAVYIGGLRLEYKHQGRGRALVLVHGLLGYSFSWRYVMPVFARTWEVFAPDLPGAGYSDCDLRLECRLSAAAGRLLSFLDAVGVGSCDLVGSSYGGATCLMMAARAPHRVRRLVLVSPANPWSRQGRWRLLLFRNPLFASVFPPLARSTRKLDRYFLGKLYGAAGHITAETLAGYQAPLGRAGILEHAVKTVKAWNSDMKELDSILPRLSGLPTLLVWGTRDGAVDPASALPLRRRLGNAELATIEGAGHLPYEERPEEFSRIVSEFLLRSP